MVSLTQRLTEVWMDTLITTSWQKTRFDGRLCQELWRGHSQLQLMRKVSPGSITIQSAAKITTSMGIVDTETHVFSSTTGVTTKVATSLNKNTKPNWKRNKGGSKIGKLAVAAAVTPKVITRSIVLEVRMVAFQIAVLYVRVNSKNPSLQNASTTFVIHVPYGTMPLMVTASCVAKTRKGPLMQRSIW